MNKVNNSKLGCFSSVIVMPDGLNLTIDPTYDKTFQFSDDDTKFKPSIYEGTTRIADEVLANIKKSSQELFMLGEVNRNYKEETPEQKKQAIELTDKIFNDNKKKQRVKRPAKTFGKNKGARK